MQQSAPGQQGLRVSAPGKTDVERTSAAAIHGAIGLAPADPSPTAGRRAMAAGAGKARFLGPTEATPETVRRVRSLTPLEKTAKVADIGFTCGAVRRTDELVLAGAGERCNEAGMQTVNR